MERRVAVTGMGAVTPIGNDAETTWESLRAGRSGITYISTFDASTFPIRIAGMVKDFDLAPYLPDPKLGRFLNRAGGFGVASAVEALKNAGVTSDTYLPEERGVAVGGSVGRVEVQDIADMTKSMNDVDQLPAIRELPSNVLIRDQNIPAATIAMIGGCEGPMVTISTACTGSAHALGEAYRRIQEGEAKLMIAGGYDALTSWLDVLGFALLGALASEYNDDPERASRPFDRDRSGFVLGEGAVMAILEDWDSAKERGAPIMAEVVGYGSSMNAYRMTDAPPDGGGTIVAVAQALKESGLRPDEVDYVAAHGTSTPGNDLCETMALKSVFGDDAYKLAISSTKSMTGHLTSAAGGLNLLAAIYAMRDQVVPPTINYEHPDPKLDLDYVPNVARPKEVRAALIDAFAFGGTNGALVVLHPDLANGGSGARKAGATA